MRLPEAKWFIPAVIIYTLLFYSIVISVSEGAEIDLKIIAQIESSNNPNAYNKRTQATGLYQITPICLKEYNNFHPSKKLVMRDMFDPNKSKQVAVWYLEKRIPQMLRHFKKDVSVDNILISYNCGINCVVKNRLPNETKNYIKKYKGAER